MKVLLLCNLCPPHFIGGYEIACLHVARALAERGHSVRLLTSSTWHATDSDPPFVRRMLELNAHQPVRPDGVEAARYRDFKAKLSCFDNTSITLDQLHEFQPETVYLFNPIGIGGLALLDMFNGLKIPWVWHLGDNIPCELFAGISSEARALFAADDCRIFEDGFFICVSRCLRAEVLANGVPQVADAEIVPGWVAWPAADHRTAYQRDGWTNFIFAGYVSEHKGVSLIVDAAAQLVSSGIEIFTIDLFGPGDASSFQTRAQAAGVGTHLRFHGPIEYAALAELYRNYDCLLFPTWERDPFPFVPLEAAAAGCVPIMTGTCGTAERLVDGVHAIKIVRSVDDLVSKMAAIMRGEVNLARIGRAGAAYVRRSLTLGHLIPRIEDLLAQHARRFPPPRYGRTAIEEQRRLQYLKNARAMEIALS